MQNWLNAGKNKTFTSKKTRTELPGQVDIDIKMLFVEWRIQPACSSILKRCPSITRAPGSDDPCITSECHGLIRLMYDFIINTAFFLTVHGPYIYAAPSTELLVLFLTTLRRLCFNIWKQIYLSSNIFSRLSLSSIS